jgi:hypothetical protein
MMMMMMMMMIDLLSLMYKPDSIFRLCISSFFFFFPVPVCAITASGVPGGTFVSMNRFSTLCG